MRGAIACSFLLSGCFAVTGWAADAKGTVVELDGLKSEAPADWKAVDQAKPFRFKQFTVTDPAKKAGDAELIIFYFGEGGGGGVDANVKRWKDMFRPPEGKAIDDVAKTTENKTAKAPYVLFEVRGTYMYKPFPMAPQAEAKANHRMLSVIMDTPKGPYFVRLVGPEATVNAQEKAYLDWIKNFK